VASRCRRSIGTWALALAVSLAFPASSEEAARETRLPGVSTWLTGRELHVEAKLSPGLPRDVEERLSSGLPTSVLWRVRLFASRNLWWDGLKDERRYEVTAVFRPVAGDFLVERRLDDRLLGSQVVPTRSEALKALSEVPGLPLFLMGPHLDRKRLVVRVKCAYASSVALGVVPTTVETGWVRSGIFDWPPPDAR
jgi:hypothetical protein